MSKKTKKNKPHATIAAVAASAGAIVNEQKARPAPLYSLAEMRAAAQAHLDKEAWDEILALGRVPLEAVRAEDRKEAEVWLLRIKLIGLSPPTLRSVYDLTKDTREEYEGTLQQLAHNVEAFHTFPACRARRWLFRTASGNSWPRMLHWLQDRRIC